MISPLYGYGLSGKHRSITLGKLFQAATEELCEHYAETLRINVYAHDKEALYIYEMSGFAMETTEVVRNTYRKSICIRMNRSIGMHMLFGA